MPRPSNARGRLTFQGMQMTLGPAELNLRSVSAEPLIEGWQIDARGHYRQGGLDAVLDRPLAVVQSARVQAVVLLPLPWAYRLPGLLSVNVAAEARNQEHFAIVDLLLDRAAEAGRAIRMTLRAPEFVALLSYVGAGRVWEAAVALGGPSLDDHVTRLIRDKIESHV
jgi:hypothetical protein